MKRVQQWWDMTSLFLQEEVMLLHGKPKLPLIHLISESEPSDNYSLDKLCPNACEEKKISIQRFAGILTQQLIYLTEKLTTNETPS